MATKKVAKPPVDVEKEKARKKGIAEVNADAALISCATSESFMKTSYGEGHDFVAAVGVLQDRIKDVRGGDMSSIEAMLVGQADALQQVFLSLMRRASAQDHLKQYSTYMTVGLKAQAQCRATIQALTELKYPRQVVITKQANISSGHQQVNNGTEQNAAPTSAAKNVIEQNELLEVNNGRQTMDTGSATHPGRENPAMATLGTLDRSQDAER
ncbi:MAG: hypothetical protein EPN46_02480 [Candidimonas sp.]|nr:MAG: hypothetical protein EPN62_12330 [Candidimonas sp.]TAM80199.1 MAG: hypothetical protein EPN46_02480 [Candidimonas sp.]